MSSNPEGLLSSYLASKNVKILNGLEVLFKNPEPGHSFFPLRSRLFVDSPIGEARTLSYAEFDKLGYALVSLPVMQPWYPHQTVEYKIVTKTPGMTNNLAPTILRRPKQFETFVQMDEASRIRLLGPNASPHYHGPWLQTNRKPQIKEKVAKTPRLSRYLDSDSHIQDAIRQRLRQKANEMELEVSTDEIPVMITDAGELVCIKLEKDVMHCGFVGATGTGKTISAHAFIDRLYWRTTCQIAILNDSVNQCFTWRKPMSTPSLVSTLNRFGENPRGLPIVVFAPNNQNLQELPFENKMSFRETINWEYLIKNWHGFTEKSPWELGSSEKYFRQYEDEILKIRDLKEIARFFREKARRKLIPDKSADRITACIADIWDKQFVDVSTNITSQWTFKTPAGDFADDPFIGALRVGLIPALNTVVLKDFHYHPQYTKYKMEQLKAYQLEIPNHEREKIFLFFDEIGDIYKKGKMKTVAGHKLVETITQGRNFQMAAIYTIQNYTQLDPEIRNNTGYFFCFTLKNREEANAFVRNHGMEKEYVDECLGLGSRKKFEALAVSNDREWVVYDIDGNKSRTRGAFKGEMLPPTSMHYRPGDEL